MTETIAPMVGVSGFVIRIFFGFRHYFGSHVIKPATTKMFTSAISKKKSQPRRISRSHRNRGSVQRTHRNRKITMVTVATKSAMLISPKIQPCETSGIPGKCQPPKDNVTTTADPVIIAAYSPRKYSANFIELYSVL